MYYFCKAIDLVDHNLLLDKMKVYRFHKDSLGWFAFYLSERKECAKITRLWSAARNPGVCHKDQY